MNQISSPNKREIVRSRPGRWYWILSILTLLTVVVIRASYMHRHTKSESPLKGDADEASGAMADILRKTPLDKRLPMLRKYINDSNPGARYAAVDALGDTGDPSVEADIENAFKDSASIVRQRAMESLIKIDRERGLRLLLIGLRDEDKWIQEAAISQLSSGVKSRPAFVDKRAVPFLMQALDSPNSVISTIALSPLRKLTGQLWKTKTGMTELERRAVLKRWKDWWKQADGQYPIASEFANLQPVRPERMDPSPHFRITDLEGKEISQQSQKGRVTLLNFWGTWCPPCQQEVPDLARLDKLHRADGLDIIGIALNETDGANGLRKWCESHGVQYQQSLSTEEITHAFGDIQEVPVSVLIDKKGFIRYRWEGERDLATFQSAVERLLQEQ